MDFGELVLIALIVIIVTWGAKGRSLGETLREALARQPESQRWTLSDWTLVVAAVSLGAVAAGMIATRR
jgi:hypothetical protein